MHTYKVSNRNGFDDDLRIWDEKKSIHTVKTFYTSKSLYFGVGPGRGGSG